MSAFVHMELSTDDPAAAKSFYKQLFGWKLTDQRMPNGVYTTFDTRAGGPGGGITAKTMPGQPTAWLPYVGVKSVTKSSSDPQATESGDPKDRPTAGCPQALSGLARLKAAYLDSSFLLAIAFGESRTTLLERKIDEFERLHSSNLLEAEARSAFSREEIALPEAVFKSVIWTLPDRPLTSEFQLILSLGYQERADLWHLACALYLSPDARGFFFLTLDARQKRVAGKLGFSV